mmetsp:Transcript_14219/g.40809  ORF Transcript_14219/g.40809 Transcript_14219/m.40809 type:complete len:223 (+) Transcript_14219:288-956(+)
METASSYKLRRSRNLVSFEALSSPVPSFSLSSSCLKSAILTRSSRKPLLSTGISRERKCTVDTSVPSVALSMRFLSCNEPSVEGSFRDSSGNEASRSFFSASSCSSKKDRRSDWSIPPSWSSYWQYRRRGSMTCSARAAKKSRRSRSSAPPSPLVLEPSAPDNSPWPKARQMVRAEPNSAQAVCQAPTSNARVPLIQAAYALASMAVRSSHETLALSSNSAP